MATRWNYQAEMINACNCDWGCPCNFNAKPTHGFCEGLWAAHITSGLCGDTALDGLKFAWGAKWPGAIHEGGGTARLWIEETASQEQRGELEGLLQGKLGGMPWTIISATIDHWFETAYVPFAWTYDKTGSSFNAGNQVRVALDSMRNLVSGAEASATILLPNGLITKELHATATKTFSIFSQGLKIAAPGKYGFYCAADHGN